MSWVDGRWVPSWTFAGLDETSWSYFGIVELLAPKGLGIWCGLLVDSPRHEERDLYEAARAAILSCQFDGRSESLMPSLARISDAVANNPIAQRTGQAHQQGGGVHLGGLASLQDNRLASFRVGRFRVEAGSVPVLIEQTTHQSWVQEGKAIPEQLRPMLQASDVSLPRERLDEKNVRWHEPGPTEITVEHHKVFGVTDPIVRIRLRARWVP